MKDEFNHVIEFKPGVAQLYYFSAAWELEPNGIKNEAGFIKWVGKSARVLANGMTVHVK